MDNVWFETIKEAADFAAGIKADVKAVLVKNLWHSDAHEFLRFWNIIDLIWIEIHLTRAQPDNAEAIFLVTFDFVIASNAWR